MAEPLRKPQVPRSTTGVPGLDDILNGGLLPHRLYLIDGDPGAGKTTLALQFLLEGVIAGENAFTLRSPKPRRSCLQTLPPMAGRLMASRLWNSLLKSQISTVNRKSRCTTRRKLN
jgi:archaellum biogenesis ATPase FlaH